MLDLKACVHLQEIEIFILIHQELNSSCSVVVTAAGQRNSLLSHFLACLLVHSRAWGLFDDLLISALNRALTFRHIDVITVQVAKNLELDVSRRLDILFNENSSITE